MKPRHRWGKGKKPPTARDLGLRKVSDGRERVYKRYRQAVQNAVHRLEKDKENK